MFASEDLKPSTVDTGTSLLQHGSSVPLPNVGLCSDSGLPHNRSYKQRFLISSIETRTTSSLNTIDSILEKEKERNKSEPWNKLDKGTKIRHLHAYAEIYIKEHDLQEELLKTLCDFFIESLEAGKLQKTKDLMYDKKLNQITSIPALRFHHTNHKFTLKNLDPKRICTLKSLTPIRTSTKSTKS